MRLIGLISYYDERPDWLSACVASLSRCCAHVVAVDGAYSLFPQARPHSGDVQAAAIVSTAQALNIGVTLYCPETVWFGNEVEKRNVLLELGKVVATPFEDWFLVVDADSVVREVPSDLCYRLMKTDLDVGVYYITESFEGGTGRYPARYLYRAAPDLRLEGTHFGYVRDGKRLWETGGLPAVETDLIVEHRRHERIPARKEKADLYYRRRDELGIER